MSKRWSHSSRSHKAGQLGRDAQAMVSWITYICAALQHSSAGLFVDLSEVAQCCPIILNTDQTMWMAVAVVSCDFNERNQYALGATAVAAFGNDWKCPVLRRPVHTRAGLRRIASVGPDRTRGRTGRGWDVRPGSGASSRSGQTFDNSSRQRRRCAAPAVHWSDHSSGV